MRHSKLYHWTAFVLCFMPYSGHESWNPFRGFGRARKNANAKVGSVESASGEAKAGREPRIFLLNGSKATLAQMEGLLRRGLGNARILRFTDGEQAWQEVVWEQPDLLVSDLDDHGLDGCALIRRLARNKVRSPILIVSSAGGPRLWRRRGTPLVLNSTSRSSTCRFAGKNSWPVRKRKLTPCRLRHRRCRPRILFDHLSALDGQLPALQPRH